MDYQEALSRLQNEELDILVAFSAYCQKHNLTWSLGGGTLLGALRHKGFIPWDDDVDVFLERNDYCKLIELMKTDPMDGYDFIAPGSSESYAAMFAKLCKHGTVFQTAEAREAGFSQGIFIDIFSADPLLKDSRAARRQITRARFWQVVSYIYHARNVNVPHGGILGIIEMFGAHVAHCAFREFMSARTITANYHEAVYPRGSVEKDYSDTYFFFPSVGDNRFPSNVLFPVKFTQFEKTLLPIPANAEMVLELTYGDWRQLPPPEKRHTHKPEKLVFSDGEKWVMG